MKFIILNVPDCSPCSLSSSSVCVCPILAHMCSFWSMWARRTLSRMSTYSSVNSPVAQWRAELIFTAAPSGNSYTSCFHNVSYSDTYFVLFFKNVCINISILEIELHDILMFHLCVVVASLPMQQSVSKCGCGQQKSGGSVSAESQDWSSFANLHCIIPSGKRKVSPRDVCHSFISRQQHAVIIHVFLCAV